jgi:hypothetical protein
MIFPAQISAPPRLPWWIVPSRHDGLPENRERDIAIHLTRQLRNLELSGELPAAGVEPTRDFRPFGF